MNRGLPNNIDAEKSLLGSLFWSKTSLQKGCEDVEPEYFYLESNAKIFEVIKDLYNNHNPVDVNTVTTELVDRNLLNQVGGVEYLSEVINSVATGANIEYYINTVTEKYTLRKLIETATEIERKANENEVDVSEAVELAERKILNVGKARRTTEFRKIQDVLTKTQEDIEMLVKNKGKITGLTTGLKDLDNITEGLHETQLIIIAARAAVGKTAFALNIAASAAKATKKNIAIFSLEMPAEMLMMRLVANRSTVELGKIQTGKISQRDYVAIDKALSEIASTKLYIDDSPNIKLMDILSKARKLKMEHPDLALIMIDYIGLITTGNKKVESRQVEVSEISRQLKALARELEIPILVLCQLSRNVEQAKTGGRKPVISDLRESGSIEQDADVIMLLSRPDYQNKDSSNMKALTKDINEPVINENGETISQVTVTVGKNRNGPIGDVKLIFTKTIGRFDEQANNDDYGD